MNNRLEIIKIGDNIGWKIGNLIIHPMNKMSNNTKNKILRFLGLKKDYYENKKKIELKYLKR